VWEVEETAARYGVAVVAADGHIVLPVGALESLRARAGDAIAWRLQDDELVLMGPRTGLRFAQELAATLVGESSDSWVVALRAERRREAEEEVRAADA
jgi:hypothetical protein